MCPASSATKSAAAPAGASRYCQRKWSSVHGTCGCARLMSARIAGVSPGAAGRKPPVPATLPAVVSPSGKCARFAARTGESEVTGSLQLEIPVAKDGYAIFPDTDAAGEVASHRSVTPLPLGEQAVEPLRSNSTH